MAFRGEKKEPQHEDHSHQPHHPQDQQHPHEADGDDKNRTSLFWVTACSIFPFFIGGLARFQ